MMPWSAKVGALVQQPSGCAAAAEGIIVPSGMPIRLHQVSSGPRWDPAHCPSLVASDSFHCFALGLCVDARCLKEVQHACLQRARSSMPV